MSRNFGLLSNFPVSFHQFYNTITATKDKHARAKNARNSAAMEDEWLVRNSETVVDLWLWLWQNF